MKESRSKPNHRANRRSFLMKGVLAAGAATAGAGLLATRLSAVSHGPEEKSGRLTPGDAPFSGSWRPPRYLRRICGSSITNSEESKIAKSRGGVVVLSTPTPLKFLTAIWTSTSTTIPRMS